MERAPHIEAIWQLSSPPQEGHRGLLPLSTAGAVWITGDEGIDVYFQRTDEKGNASALPVLLYSAEAHSLVIGLGSGLEQAGRVAVDLRHGNGRMTNMEAVESTGAQAAHQEAVAELIDQSWSAFLNSVSPGFAPKNYEILEGEESPAILKDRVYYPPRGIRWVQAEGGLFSLMGIADYVEGGWLPVSADSWLKGLDESPARMLRGTAEMLGKDPLLPGLRACGTAWLDLVIQYLENSDQKETDRLRQKRKQDNFLMSQALKGMHDMLARSVRAEKPAPAQMEWSLLSEMQLIGAKIRVNMRAPRFHPDGDSKDVRHRIKGIVQASHIRMREVLLRGDWWKSENGHLLGVLDESGKAVALICEKPGLYIFTDPEDGNRRKVDAKEAARFQPVAYMFFRPFRQKIGSVFQLIGFLSGGLKKDLGYLLLASFTGGILALLTPILTGIVMDDVIPQADRSYLLQVAGIMFVVAVVAALLFMARGLFLLRIEVRSNLELQAAVMDHLLRLPTSFFKKYNAGDLTNRTLGINTIRQMLTNTVFTAVLNGVFSLVNVLLLFWYDSSLAWVALGMTIVGMGVVIFAGLLKLRFDRQKAALSGRLQGMVFEFLSGINKIRVTGSENRVFFKWSDQFSRMETLNLRSGSIGNWVGAFHSGFPVMANLIFFLMIYLSMDEGLAAGETKGLISVGIFIAFMTAFRQMLFQSMDMGQALVSALEVVPLYERVRPIFEADAETREGDTDPGELNGEIELNHLSFRYDAEGPLILDEVSMQVDKGQMVAIVGASGSGKSTLMRLLLGFESPESGSIYYDGKDFATLDVAALRRQIGVVLQNGEVMQGDIYRNIVGSSNLKLQDAWDAARAAGLAEDIEALPMRMHTVISPGGSTFSGGQLQRLMIARAIVHKPRLIFMDEATSALDNRTQEIVTDSLEKLQATRIVIAHRLSTIRKADRIYVMDKGRIAESGSYEELMKLDGIFASLAKRQLA